MTQTGVLRPTSTDDLVGLEPHPNQWHWLTQEEIGSFADAPADHQWIHADTERAAGPFGDTIGHGLLMLSLGHAFMEELKLMASDGFAHDFDYGYNKVRFPHAGKVGIDLRMRATITNVTAISDESAQFTTIQCFEAKGIEKPICFANSLGRFAEYPAASA